MRVGARATARLDVAGVRPRADSFKLGIIAGQFRLANEFHQSEADLLELAEQQMGTEPVLIGRTIDTLEQAVASGPHICGERFTAADVYVGSQIIWGMMFGTIESRPAFAAYADRLKAREAYQRAAALDDALMPEQEAEPA